MRGQRLRAAVFLTFKFDPGFLEQEVIPVFVDVALSNVSALRLPQLEDAIQRQGCLIAVYYDRNGLEAGVQSPKLNLRRVPVAWRTGFFHPKTVLLLVDDVDSPEDSSPTAHLIVAALSANLTRAGWWQNVEVCHIEEVADGDTCSFRDDLLSLMAQVKRASRADQDHGALDLIRDFVRRLIATTPHPSDSAFRRLYAGGMSVSDFLSDAMEDELTGLNLEVISPYFDDKDARPLSALIARFKPEEVRVFLPRTSDGAALCTTEYHDAVKQLPKTGWGHLPQNMLRMGKAEEATERFVHAKVYRFFSSSRHKEVFFVGSVNLTSAAHSRGGNFETGFLVQTAPERVPEWWLALERNPPRAFYDAALDDEGIATSPLSALEIRYHWDEERLEAFWTRSSMSPALTLEAQGAHLFTMDPLPPGRWVQLSGNQAEAMAAVLPSTSFVTARCDGIEAAVLLVQEEGMSHKPSLLLTLSAADILRYWALLTPEQRAAFLEQHAAEIPAAALELGIDLDLRIQPEPASMFASFASIYHAFWCLQREVAQALEEERDSVAVYRLFGRKYDSLGQLLRRITKEEQGSDPVVAYLIALCAKQLVAYFERSYPTFRAAHTRDFAALWLQMEDAEAVKERLRFDEPADRVAFLEWFEARFLRRMPPPEVTP
jgi:hypothetical protein